MLYWRPPVVNGNTIDFAVRVTGTGFIGVGWNAMDGQLSMVDGEALIGWVDDVTALPTYVLRNLVAQDVTQFTAASFAVINFTGDQTNGVTTIQFTRIVGDGRFPLALNGTATNQQIGSYGATDTIQYHGPTQHATNYLAINYASGAAIAIVDPYAILKIIHGSLMILGWGVMLPFGMLWARYARRVPNNMAKDVWFRVHRPTQYTFSAVVFVALVVAFVQVNGSHFQTVFHAQLGITIMILLLVHVIVAYFRPHKEPGEAPTTARVAFEYFHHWNGRYARSRRFCFFHVSARAACCASRLLCRFARGCT